MSIVTAVVLSMFLLTVTGCATPSALLPTHGKKDTTVKPAKHDEKKDMNEESQNAIR